MPSDKDLTVFLCVENVDNCDILLNQLGSGDIFGPNQHLRLLLQGCDQSQLEALSWDVQDCAFPLISGISTCTSFDNVGLHPDVVMVLLTDRLGFDAEREKSHLKSSLSVSNLEQFTDLHRLVHYTKSLADALVGCSLENTPVVMLGDLAHTAASLLSNHLSTTLRAGQMIALDGAEGNPRPGQVAQGRGQMSKVTRFCKALGSWWGGQQARPDRKTKLGTKFVDTKQYCVNGKSTGYFFSAPVDFSGRAVFSARLDFDVDQAHMAKVKAETDAAHALVARINEIRSEQDQRSCYHIAHL